MTGARRSARRHTFKEFEIFVIATGNKSIIKTVVGWIGDGTIQRTARSIVDINGCVKIREIITSRSNDGGGVRSSEIVPRSLHSANIIARRRLDGLGDKCVPKSGSTINKRFSLKAFLRVADSVGLLDEETKVSNTSTVSAYSNENRGRGVRCVGNRRSIAFIQTCGIIVESSTSSIGAAVEHSNNGVKVSFRTTGSDVDGNSSNNVRHSVPNVFEVRISTRARITSSIRV